MGKIILNGNDDDILSIELSDILELIPEGYNYKWKILWINGTSKIDQKFDMLNFEKQTKKGYELSFEALKNLSFKIYQLFELVLIGNKNNVESFNNNTDDEFLKKECDFFIELVDSSYWELTSKNEIFKQKIKRLTSPK